MITNKNSFDNLSVGDYVKVKDNLVNGNFYVYENDYDEDKYICIRYSHLAGHLPPGSIARVTRVENDGTCRAIPAFTVNTTNEGVWYSFGMLEIIGKDCNSVIEHREDKGPYMNQKTIGDHKDEKHYFTFGEAMDFLRVNHEENILAFVKNIDTGEYVSIDKHDAIILTENWDYEDYTDFIPTLDDMKAKWIKCDPSRDHLIQASEHITQAMKFLASTKGNMVLQEVLGQLNKMLSEEE